MLFRQLFSLSVLTVVGSAFACSAAGNVDTGPAPGPGSDSAGAPGDQAGEGGSANGGLGSGASGPLGAAGGSGAPERCYAAGSTRPCCDAGTQTCGSGELPTWGPCLDSNGREITACEIPSPPETLPPEPPPPEPPPPEPPPPEPPPPEPPPPPPPTECGPGMVCKPGAIRYCDVAGFEYTKATCTPTGQWGPCEPVGMPVGWCDPTGFSPEICCPPLHLCCQNDPGGPFEDFGSGACVEIACP